MLDELFFVACLAFRGVLTANSLTTSNIIRRGVLMETYGATTTRFLV
jgi:hypothetical protein